MIKNNYFSLCFHNSTFVQPDDGAVTLNTKVTFNLYEKYFTNEFLRVD